MINKRGTDAISIAYIVIATIVLLSFAWYTFLVKTNSAEVQLEGYRVAEQVYLRESQIKFYVNEMVQESARGLDLKDPGVKMEFLENLDRELDEYRVGQNYIIPELKEIEWQLDERKVKLDEEGIGIRLKFKVENSFLVDEFEDIKVTYVFEKEYFSGFNRDVESVAFEEAEVELEESGENEGDEESDGSVIGGSVLEDEKVDLSGENFFLKDGSSGQEELFLGDYDTGVYFYEEDIFARSYEGVDVDVGGYEDDGEIELEKYAGLRLPLGERSLVEDFEGERYSEVVDAEVYGGYVEIPVKDGEIEYGVDVIEEVKSNYDSSLGKKGGYSCGPQALRHAFEKLGKEVSLYELQEDRGDGGGLVRGFLSLFSKEARQITWPDEMKKSVRNNGFESERDKIGIKLKFKIEEAVTIKEREDVKVEYIFEKEYFG